MRKRLIPLFCSAVCLFLCMTSCDNDPQRREPSIPDNTSSGETSSQSVLPPFIDTEIDSKYNLAGKGIAFTDSVSLDYPTYTADKLNDGDILTRWLSGRPGTEEEPSFFGIEWDEEQTFDVIMLHWDAAHPAEGGFSLAAAYDDAELELPEHTVVRLGTDRDDGQTDVILFHEPLTAKSFTVTCTQPYFSEEYGTIKTTPSCYEIEIYFSEDIEGDVPSLESDVISDMDVYLD